jgi:hypothetical protein
MGDDVPTGSATVSVDVKMLPAEESGYVDDDDEEDEINQHVQGVLGYFPVRVNPSGSSMTSQQSWDICP